MKLPRPRFTVRRMMVAVAVVALMISGGSWARSRYREAVLFFGNKLIYHRTNASFHQPLPEMTPPIIWFSPPSSADLARERRLAEYHEVMVLKYERALHYPWLPVAPDPPEPR